MVIRIILYLLLTHCVDTYVGFGFTGGINKSKINNLKKSIFLPNGELKNSALMKRVDVGFEELDPNYIARSRGVECATGDNMISRASFLTRPIPDSIKEKILRKNDERDALPFDYTQGFVSGPNDHGMTLSSENLIFNAGRFNLSRSFSTEKQPQALVMDPKNPRTNFIVDVPAGNNYYPWNNPYIIVSSDGPIKTKLMEVKDDDDEAICE
ncbi:hypothetical protein COBT_000617 [Conglomerata obtusa]